MLCLGRWRRQRRCAATGGVRPMRRPL